MGRQGKEAPKVVYLVRHGETEWSGESIYSGRIDIPLTDNGREQAAQAAAELREAGVDRVYSSPLSRAMETAQAIADATGAPLRREHDLCEVDHGPIAGMSRDAAHERYGDAFDAWREDPFGSPLEGMEPLERALERARGAVEKALAEAERPALVAHQGILRLVLIALGEVERADYFDTKLPAGKPRAVEVHGGSAAALGDDGAEVTGG